MTNRFARIQRHVGSAVAALALSTFFIGAAIAPVTLQQAPIAGQHSA